MPHKHWPLTHCSPTAHAWPHMPQSVLLLIRSAQPDGQHASVGWHTLPLHVHCPSEAVHANGDVQVAPHAPQSAFDCGVHTLAQQRSVGSGQTTVPHLHCVAWQAPPQQNWPAMHGAPPPQLHALDAHVSPGLHL
jgi:hypothetical protein